MRGSIRVRDMRYTAISTEMWNDKEFVNLPDEEKLAYIFFLTSPFTNMAGFYRLPLKYAELYIGDKAKAILQKPTKLWKYDFDTEQILLPNYLKYNTVRSPNQMKGLAGAIRGIEYSKLYIDFFLSLYKYCEPKMMEYIPQDIKKYMQMLIEQEPGCKAEVIKEMLLYI